MRTLFVPFLQIPLSVQSMRNAAEPRFASTSGKQAVLSDTFEKTAGSVITSPKAIAVDSVISLPRPFAAESILSPANGPLVSQMWIPPLDFNLPGVGVNARVVVPSDALSTQGYQRVEWQHPDTQERFDLRRTHVESDGTMRFELRPANQPDVRPQVKTLHVSQLPQMAVIDDFRPQHDMDGDGVDCVSHGDMVLQVARRVNPFGVYHVVQPAANTLGMSKEAMPSDGPVIDALLRQPAHSISSINFSYGQTVAIPLLGFLLGEEVTLESLPNQAGIIREYMQQAFRMDYGKFKAAYFEGFLNEAKQYAKATNANPSDFTDNQIGYDFMFMYDRLREAHLDHKQFKRLKEAGIQPYLSAGNSGGHTISLSALSPDAIVVGGLDVNGEQAEFSSSVLPHHPSVRAEYPVRVTPKGINFTDTPDVVDIPNEWLPVTATLMQVGHLLGQPVKGLVFQDGEVKELLARTGRRYTAQYNRNVQKQSEVAIPMRPPLTREGLIKTLNTKLLTHAQLSSVYQSLGISQVHLKPISPYVAMAHDAAILQVGVNEAGITMPALTKPMETLRGTSFASPAVMAKRELDNFVLQHFSFSLAA